MDADKYKIDGSCRFQIKKAETGGHGGLADKAAGLAALEKSKRRIELWQQRLYAEGAQALLVVLQAMDAAGKDGTVKHVFSGVNPQGICVADFKGPTKEELAHDYLWRIHQQVPKRGCIGVFNRSYYEDVLVARVLNLPEKQPLPAAARRGVWQKRYRHIREFEAYLEDNGVRVLKLFLHVSPEVQRERLLARLDDPHKNWKFEAGDLETRAMWGEYMKAYEQAVNETATHKAPWYVVPADHKWYARAVVAQIVADTLADMHPQMPQVGKQQGEQLERYRAALRGE